MKSTRLALIGVAAAGALILALTRTRGLVPSSVPAAPSAVPRAEIRWSWPEGSSYAYDFEWTSTQESSMFGRPVSGSTKMAGAIRLRSYGKVPGGEDVDLRATIHDLRGARLRLLEQEVLADDDSARRMFDGKEVFLRVSPGGIVRSIGFREGEPDVFVHLAQWLVERLFVALPGDAVEASFVREEPHALGRALVRYVREEPLVLSRTIVRLDELATLTTTAGLADVNQGITSRGRLRLAPEGHLVDLSDDESITITPSSGPAVATARSTLSVKLMTAGRFEDREPRPAHLDERAPGRHQPGATAIRKALEQRVDGLTAKAMVADLTRFGGAGQMPDHGRWLWRATGLLTLEPAAANDLTAVFGLDGLGPRGRELVMDLLAFSGTAEAQSVMRDLIRGPIAKMPEEERMMLVQRVGFLHEPRSETLALIASELDRTSRGSMLFVACAYTLGAAIGHLGPEDERVRVHDERLRRELARAANPADRATFLRALGNAGFPANAPLVLEHARDADESVRAAAATALRKTPSPRATATLAEMGADSSSLVQRTAIDTLGDHPLDPATLRALHRALTGAKTPSDVLGALVNLVARAPRVDPAMRAAARDLLELAKGRAHDDAHLAARIAAMLDDTR